MNLAIVVSAAALAALPAAQALVPIAVHAQVAVTSWHNDAGRTGENRDETLLTPASVGGGRFGKLCAYPVDGQVYAQPLVVPGVKVAGKSHEVLFIATEHDSVYAFDAACGVRRPLWKVSFLGRGVTPMPCVNDKQTQCDVTIIAPEHGVTGTPAIDPASRTLFVVAQTVDHGAYTQTLHALDLGSGAERAGSPVVIAARSAVPPNRRFDPAQAVERSGLALAGGVVLIPFASNDSANGWLLGYDAARLTQRWAWCVTPTGKLGGIWGGGAAPAIDEAGRVLVGTGNGSFDMATGGPNLGMSVARLDIGGSAPEVIDYFTPSREAKLSQRDLDLDSGGLVLLPRQGGPHPREAVIGFKPGELFLLDRDNLGHLGSAGALQHFTANRGGIYSTAAYAEGTVYMAGVDGHLAQWPLKDGAFPSAPSHESRATFGYPGATPSVSSDGGRNGIVWAIDVAGKVQGGPSAVLRAYDAADVSHELWSSAARASDAAAPGVKFSVPTIANGRVFLGAQGEVEVYGLK